MGRRSICVVVACALLTASPWLGLCRGQTPPKKKLPAPTAADEQKAMADVRGAYRGEYEKAATPEEKAALAKKLLEQAKRERPGTKQYVILKVARDVAVGGGDATEAFAAIDALDAAFEVDAVRLRSETLTKLLQAPLRPEQRRPVVAAAVILAAEASQADKYDVAQQALEHARTTAQEMRDSALMQQVTARVDELAEMKLAYAVVGRAQKMLAEKPDDRGANLTLGTYLCLWKGDWTAGLPALAKGSDPILADLATRDRAAADGEQRAAVADGWWDLAQKHDGLAKRQLQLHARQLYAQATPQLPEGTTKAKVQRRLQESAPVAAVRLTAKAGLAADAKKVVRESAAGKRILKRTRYESMLGSYFNDGKAIPFASLAVPSGGNVMGSKPTGEIRNKLKKVGKLTYTGTARFEVLAEGTYEIEHNLDKVTIARSAAPLSKGKSTVQLKKGLHEIHVSEKQSKQDAVLKVRNKETGQEVPLFNLGVAIEELLDRARGAELSGWQPVEVKTQ
jgi:hypothetical protein